MWGKPLHRPACVERCRARRLHAAQILLPSSRPCSGQLADAGIYRTSPLVLNCIGFARGAGTAQCYMHTYFLSHLPVAQLSQIAHATHEFRSEVEIKLHAKLQSSDDHKTHFPGAVVGSSSPRSVRPIYSTHVLPFRQCTLATSYHNNSYTTKPLLDRHARSIISSESMTLAQV